MAHSRPFDSPGTWRPIRAPARFAGGFFELRGSTDSDAAAGKRRLNGRNAGYFELWFVIRKRLVELMRFELTTSAVRLQRSPI
jgi:hypothetical protein